VHNVGNPCDYAFDIFQQAKRLGKSDTEALISARQYLQQLPDISDVERARHLDDLDKILDKSVQWNVLEPTDALHLPGPNRGLIFVRENASMPPHARIFEGETLGSWPDIAPALRYDNPDGYGYVKFDGFIVKKDGVVELIDAKTEVALGESRDFVSPSIVAQLRRQSRAIAQNGNGFRAILEVPTQEVKQLALDILRRNSIIGIEVRIR
jgi:hypothetical protein